MKNHPNGVFVQTKGSRDVGAEMLDIIDILGPKKAVIYISLTFLDEEKAKIVEPGASSPIDRLSLAYQLKKDGYHVIAAYNPMYRPWFSQDDTLHVLHALMEDDIRHFYIQGLHMSPRRLAQLPKERLKRLFGEDGYDPIQAHGHARAFADFLVSGEFRQLQAVDNSVWDKEVFVHHPALALPTDFWAQSESMFRCLPTIHGFMAHLHAKMASEGKDHVQATFHDFAEYCMSNGRERLFRAVFPSSQVNRYLFTANLGMWKRNQEVDMLLKVLNVLWNEKHTLAFQKHIAFWPIADGKRGLLKDDRGNLIFYFDGTLRDGNEVKTTADLTAGRR